MAHFALLDENNIVTFVTVGRDEDNGKEVELSARTGQVYRQTATTLGEVFITPLVPTNQIPISPKLFAKTTPVLVTPMTM